MDDDQTPSDSDAEGSPRDRAKHPVDPAQKSHGTKMVGLLCIFRSSPSHSTLFAPLLQVRCRRRRLRRPTTPRTTSSLSRLDLSSVCLGRIRCYSPLPLLPPVDFKLVVVVVVGASSPHYPLYNIVLEQ